MPQSAESHVAIIGTGQMGLVMADAIASRGISVSMWGPRKEIVERLDRDRALPERLADFRLPDAVRTTADPARALAGATVAVNAIPTQFIRPVWTELLPHGPCGLPLVSTAKGIERGTLLRPTEVLDELARSITGTASELAVLSGPTIATELAARLPAALIAASDNAGLARTVQDLLNVPWIRTYTLDDPVGVEIAGATKNVIALAAGMLDGLEVGDNAKSMLLSRGLAEISRLGESLGARLETFFGIAGVGDLATTCFSPFGRNRTCGEAIGRGESLEDYMDRTDSVVEGVASTRAVSSLAEREGVDMPITRAVGAILFGGMSPRDAIDRLMDRQLKSEELGEHAPDDPTPR
ncbi:MAG: NAD(P)H-dependent glycerol-3-phosphate dehydrogenase [Planctomycetota bacterium]|nr:NAD(P)H-dependent glycerol-3-phosphate dehydrogenase [Planctomycetota bacterium]